MRLAQRFGWEDYFPWQKANGLADHQSFYQWLLKNSEDTAHLQFDQTLQQGKQIYWSKTAEQLPKGEIKPLKIEPTALVCGLETSDQDAYPLCFQTTRVASHTSNVGQWWTWTQDLEPSDTIQVHPSVATALGLENGESVRVVSADEIIEGKAWINRMVPPWLVWSSRRMQTSKVLIHRKGQSPEEACDKLKAIMK